MPSSNELAVDLAAAAQEVSNAAVADAEVEQQLSANDASTDALEVPESTFFDEGSDSADDSSETAEPTQSSKGQSVDPAKTFTYKANGKDVSITYAEAVKRLSLADGARKAFSEKAKIQKERDQLKTEVEEGRKFKDSWDKLEDMRHDPEKLYELVFNKPYKDFEKEVTDRQALYKDATPEERQILDYEARVRNLERESARTKSTAEATVKRMEEAQFNVDKKQLQTQLEREFFKHAVVNADNPQVANKLKKMLWRNSIADLKEYANPNGDVDPRAVARVFQENANALKGFKSEALAKDMKAAVEAKKENAKTKAQLASTSNFVPKIDSSLSKLDPLKLFQRMTRRG